MTIRHILTHIYNFFNVSLRQQKADEAYLNEATSLVDLERRMREIEQKRGVVGL